MDYKEALNYIHNTYKFGSKLGLENIGKLLELMGNPQKKLKFVHVAGTNGKGSTTAFISSILNEAGYKVGVYTSPYIQRFTERIRIAENEIEEQRLAEITEFIKQKIDHMVSQGYNHPTEFEVVTALGFQYFYEEACDIVVLEVGLGGRFDATNIIEQPDAVVITSISLDHIAILGDTLPKIAYEKAGTIKNGSDVVLYGQSKEVEEVVQNACIEKRGRLHIVDFTSLYARDFNMDGQSFDFEDFSDLRISLLGEHQLKNASLAIKAITVLSNKGWNISKDHIYKGLEKATWAGRIEVLSKNPLFLIDGAHNEDGVRALIAAINKHFPDQKVTFIFGVLKDKDYVSLIKQAAVIADSFIAIAPPNERALPVDELMLTLSNHCKNVSKGGTIKEAVEMAKERWIPGQLICAFGSLYYIGEVRDIFNVL